MGLQILQCMLHCMPGADVALHVRGQGICFFGRMLYHNALMLPRRHLFITLRRFSRGS